MSGSAFAVTHHAFSSGAGRTSDGNGSHASTLKSPSYTKSVSWQHYLQIEESSDDGDEYDYSPAKEEWVITAANAKPQCDIIHEAWQSRAVIRYDMAVPLNLSERSARQSTGRVGVVLVVTLSHNSRRIDVDINLDNQADDHRLRVLVPTPFNTDSVLADTQFGSLTRP